MNYTKKINDLEAALVEGMAAAPPGYTMPP